MRILLGILVVAAIGIAIYFHGGSTESDKEVAGPVEEGGPDDGPQIDRR